MRPVLACRPRVSATPAPFRPPDVSHLPLAVVHADRHLAVVVKPPELLSCEGTTTVGCDSVVARVREAFPHASGPILAHRLDAPTSGLLVVALDPETHRRLSAAFAARRVSRTYVAVVRQPVCASPLHVGASGSLSLPLGAAWRERPRQRVDLALGKPAVTDWEVLTASAETARLRLSPRTGRTHQLRVHCADPAGLAAPIVGDRLYGPPPGDPRARLLLHAATIALIHPMTGDPLSFEAPPDF
jgi:tRNA pseudouridine32 synthase/23S rRNA pseudouridine746 synthase